jgi:hypothetical protein
MPSSLVRAHAAVEDRSSSARAPPPPLYRGVDGGYVASHVRPGSSAPSTRGNAIKYIITFFISPEFYS